MSTFCAAQTPGATSTAVTKCSWCGSDAQLVPRGRLIGLRAPRDLARPRSTVAWHQTWCETTITDVHQCARCGRVRNQRHRERPWSTRTDRLVSGTPVSQLAVQLPSCSLEESTRCLTAARVTGYAGPAPHHVRPRPTTASATVSSLADDERLQVLPGLGPDPTPLQGRAAGGDLLTACPKGSQTGTRRPVKWGKSGLHAECGPKDEPAPRAYHPNWVAPQTVQV